MRERGRRGKSGSRGIREVRLAGSRGAPEESWIRTAKSQSRARPLKPAPNFIRADPAKRVGVLARLEVRLAELLYRSEQQIETARPSRAPLPEPLPRVLLLPQSEVAAIMRVVCILMPCDLYGSDGQIDWKRA